MSLRERIEARFLRTALDLSPSVQRRLAGRPVVREGATLAPETQLMLRIQRLVREPDVASLPLEKARRALVRQARLVGGELAIGSVTELELEGATGSLGARLYTPRSLLAGREPAPLLVFLHGGGMMYGDLDSHDAPCRFLAERADVLVLAIDYRLAPEHPYPAGPDDSATAYRWVLANAERLGADPERIAIGGDSAGGHFAALTAIAAAEEGLPCAFQLLLYPVTDFAGESASRLAFDEGFYLTREFIDGAEAAYLSPDDDRHDPRVSPVHRTDFPKDVAPAFVVACGFDPLRDEGEAYAHLLAEHGVRVEARRFDSLIHGFVNVVGCGHQTVAAMEEIAQRLRRALH